ncbi:MAG: DUF979 domain-containing protein [Dokdonella sp.]|uniref:DUF979 domain-containing protein n=1 Tax=Dokdonella sp. TaxID=2291710 RepID=UPI003F7F0165
MLTLEPVYLLLGAFLVFAAIADVRERRHATAAFWAILSLPFLVGDAILASYKAGTAWPAQAMGVGVIALGVMAAWSRRRPSDDDAAAQVTRRGDAARLGNRLFGPALLIPLVTLLVALAAQYGPAPLRALIDAKQSTLVALGIASVVAFAVGLRVTGARVGAGLHEGHRVLDALGWAALLPMLLATLGSVFAATGVGDAIAALVAPVIPTDSRLACLTAFTLGMVLFTAIMGNAFAAFPVLMAGIGLPLLVQRHGAHPAVLGAIGMLTGYCGTLLTPMAANFNIVPVVLLELPDQYAVIRQQLPTAVGLLVVNVGLLWVLAF